MDHVQLQTKMPAREVASKHINGFPAEVEKQQVDRQLQYGDVNIADVTVWKAAVINTLRKREIVKN
ncbi:hypothetical protein ABBQ38_012889 [Trebouxia sp. C0009 RCD-2024]